MARTSRLLFFGLGFGLAVLPGLSWGQRGEGLAVDRPTLRSTWVKREAGMSEGTARVLGAMANRLGAQNDVWFSDGDFPSIIQLLRFEVDWTPENYEAQSSLGWMYGNTEQFELELATYIRFRDMFPGDPEAAYPLGEFYFRRRAYSQAVSVLAGTIDGEVKPHANSYRLLAHAYDRLGMWKESLAVWDAYLKLNPADGAAIRNRGRVADKLKGGSG